MWNVNRLKKCLIFFLNKTTNERDLKRNVNLSLLKVGGLMLKLLQKKKYVEKLLIFFYFDIWKFIIQRT